MTSLSQSILVLLLVITSTCYRVLRMYTAVFMHDRSGGRVRLADRRVCAGCLRRSIGEGPIAKQRLGLIGDSSVPAFGALPISTGPSTPHLSLRMRDPSNLVTYDDLESHHQDLAAFNRLLC